MSIRVNKLCFTVDQPRTSKEIIFKRPLSTAMSPKPSPRPSDHSPRRVLPYLGMSIGLISLQKRDMSPRKSSFHPNRRNKYFSENLVEKAEGFQNSSGKFQFIIPNKLDFRRFKRVGWSDYRSRSGYSSEIIGIDENLGELAGTKKEITLVNRVKVKNSSFFSGEFRGKGLLNNFK